MLTDVHVKGVEGLHAVEFVRGHIALAEGRHPQIDREVIQGRVTEPAFGHGYYRSSLESQDKRGQPESISATL